MDGRYFNERKDHDNNVVVEELSSLTTIPEDQMVTVQEEVITTGNDILTSQDDQPLRRVCALGSKNPTEDIQDKRNIVDEKSSAIVEEVIDEGTAPKREAEELSVLAKKRKLTLKPKPTRSEGSGTKVKKSKKKDKGLRRVSAYMLFSRFTRPTVIDENPDMKVFEITSKLATMWSKLGDSEKDYWKDKEAEENAKIGITDEKKKKKKKKKSLVPPPPDNPPEALDLAAHLKLLGDSMSKMGEITGELYERGDYSEYTVSALLTNLLDCLICASAPLIYLSSFIDQIKVIPEEQQVKMLDNIAYIMPGLENFK